MLALGRKWGSKEVWTDESDTDGEAEGSKPLPPKQLGFHLFYILIYIYKILFRKKKPQNSTTKFENQKFRANVYAQKGSYNVAI